MNPIRCRINNFSKSYGGRSATSCMRRPRIVIRSAGDGVTEAEKVLMRAAASPRESRAAMCVFQALREQPECFEGFSVTPILHRLCDRESRDPMDAISDLAQRALLAQVLFRESSDLELKDVEAALQSLKYRHLEALQRRVRADIAEAERRGDLAQLAVFMAEKVKVDREMRDAGGW